MAAVVNPRKATLGELTAALNTELGSGIASDDGQHLILTSQTAGAASRIAIDPLEVTTRCRFVTRAFITDEAAQAVLGFVRSQAHGTAATLARVGGGEGSPDLSRGVDLRESRYLRVVVDDLPARDVDCATRAQRPRSALLGEIVEAINNQLGQSVASHDGSHLILTSPTKGASSRIAFESPRAADALDVLLGLPPGTFRGRDATRVSFRGTVDLSAGVDLPANAAIKLAIDDVSANAHEIPLAGAQPVHKALNEIVIAINLALQAVGIVALPDGALISLTSLSTGTGSQIHFAVPGGADATKAIFGITPPRSYHGADPQKAQVVGERDLSGVVDLSVARFLRIIALDGQPPGDVDCAARATDSAHSTLSQIIEAINSAVAPGVASADGTHLKLSSIATGGGARLELLPYTAGDARSTLLGNVPDLSTGRDPAPAVMTGTADLLAPVNLAERSTLRLAVDGGRAVEVDVAGAAPDATFLDEIVAKINATVPGLASATDDDHLRLTSPTKGESGSLEVLPTGALELMEYPPETVDEPPRTVRHGDRWTVNNSGAADADLEIELSTDQGEAGPELVNLTTGQRIRAMVVLRAGEKLQLRRAGEAGLRAEVIAADDTHHAVPGSRILVGPLGAQTWVPFVGEWGLSGGDADNWAKLQLNNPFAPVILLLRALRRGAKGHQIRVSVTQAELTASGAAVVAEGSESRLVGWVRGDALGYCLADAADATMARLRAGPGVAFDDHRDRVVAVRGPLYPGEGAPPLVPLMVVQRLDDLYDVKFAADGTPPETYPGVAIGVGPAAPEGLTFQIISKPSQLVFAEELDKSSVLVLPRGQSEWVYLNCEEARFDRAHFGEEMLVPCWLKARFAGGCCHERGVFDVSRFARKPPDPTPPDWTPPEPEAAVFAPAGPLSDPGVEIRLRWTRYQPGAFIVNLPANLPEIFGARFDQARFARAGDTPETFENAVTEPPDDKHFLVDLINKGLPEEEVVASTLVTAAAVPRVPLGWEAMAMPFHHPRARKLTNGTDSEPARIYLAEKDVPGFIELTAREPGVWGNTIEVTARKAGPARFDVTIGYRGARFESARQVAWAGHVLDPGEDPLPALTAEVLKPRPVGVLQAKAAGVRAEVTRDRTESAIRY